MSERVHYKFDEGVSTITFDDGKANVLSVAMLNELNEALDRAEQDKGIVVLVGRPGMFSGGFDLKVFQQGGEELLAMLEGGAHIAERLQRFPQPVVAACTGHAIAMGVFLLLSCDYRIGAEGEFRICANEVEIGLTVPHFAIETCRQKLTPSAFHRAINTAEPFSGENAVAGGFLSETIAPEKLIERAREKAKQWQNLKLEAYRTTKARALEQHFRTLQDAISKDAVAWKAAAG